MKITDINGKEREVKSLDVVMCKRPSSIKGDDPKEIVDQAPYVQAIIIGRKTEWVEWYPYKEFKELNPEVEL